MKVYALFVLSHYTDGYTWDSHEEKLYDLYDDPDLAIIDACNSNSDFRKRFLTNTLGEEEDRTDSYFAREFLKNCVLPTTYDDFDYNNGEFTCQVYYIPDCAEHVFIIREYEVKTR